MIQINVHETVHEDPGRKETPPCSGRYRSERWKWKPSAFSCLCQFHGGAGGGSDNVDGTGDGK